MTSANLSSVGMEATNRLDSTGSVGGRTITAFFDTREAAQKATDDLVAIGIPRQHIRETAGSTDVTETPKATKDKNFWDELKDLFLPDPDRDSYAEGLSRGGFLLSVKADEGMYTRVLDVLDTDGAVDMDVREKGWRDSGWSGYAARPSAAATANPAWTRDSALDRSRLRSYSGVNQAATGLGESPMGSFSAATDRTKITEHMEVFAADGIKIGTVDHLDGPDRIKLAKNTSPDGQHHYVPLTWVDHVDTHVHLNRTLADIKTA